MPLDYCIILAVVSKFNLSFELVKIPYTKATSHSRPINQTDISGRTLIQVVLKLFLGELRPYFLDVCRPLRSTLDSARNAGRANAGLTMTNYVWASTSMCTGKANEIRNAMQSFPSGHTGSAFTVGMFLALYLNSKTKAFANYQTAFWKILIIMMPLLGAGLAAALIVIDGVSVTKIDLFEYDLINTIGPPALLFSLISNYTSHPYCYQSKNTVSKFP